MNKFPPEGILRGFKCHGPLLVAVAAVVAEHGSNLAKYPFEASERASGQEPMNEINCKHPLNTMPFLSDRKTLGALVCVKRLHSAFSMNY